MTRQNPHRPFVPDPGQMARSPAISGNSINGLGETVARRPWSRPGVGPNLAGKLARRSARKTV